MYESSVTGGCMTDADSQSGQSGEGPAAEAGARKAYIKPDVADFLGEVTVFGSGPPDED